jgi:hypothetical protein
MKNISENFLDKTKEEQQEILNNIVPNICSLYCCRDNCHGCFIQELTDKVYNTYILVKRYETEQMEFYDWTYRSDDYDGYYSRVYLITGSHDIAKELADWARNATVGEIHGFDGGEIEIREID